MARKPRIEFAGALYHVVSRGDRGEAIYHDEEDRVRFLNCVGEVCDRTGWKIHAFGVMTNHYHFLLETREANLVAGMKWLQGTYTQRFNRRHGLQGHLFQGRYKAMIIDAEEPGYFLQVSNYIHLNPVRAGLVGWDEALRSYRWSSFPLYLLPESRRPEWLCVDRVLGELGGLKDNWRGRKAYQGYMEELVEGYHRVDRKKRFDEEWKLLRRGWYLGGDGFRDRLVVMLGRVMQGKQRETYKGDEVRAHDEAAAEGLFREGLRILGIREQDLEKMAKGSKEKQVLVWWIRKKTVVGRRWISQRLGMGDASRVTQAVTVVDKTRDNALLKLKNRLQNSS